MNEREELIKRGVLVLLALATLGVLVPLAITRGDRLVDAGLEWVFWLLVGCCAGTISGSLQYTVRYIRKRRRK